MSTFRHNNNNNLAFSVLMSSPSSTGDQHRNELSVTAANTTAHPTSVVHVASSDGVTIEPADTVARRSRRAAPTTATVAYTTMRAAKSKAPVVPAAPADDEPAAGSSARARAVTADAPPLRKASRVIARITPPADRKTTVKSGRVHPRPRTRRRKDQTGRASARPSKVSH